MRLLVLRSLWTNGFDLEAALADCRGAFDGVEGPLPADASSRKRFCERLHADGCTFVAEVATGGGYVPHERSPEKHLEEFRRKVSDASLCNPLFITALAGCDAWPIAQSVDFLGRAIGVAREFGVAVSFETHRSRPTFNPWTARELLTQLPGMRLTCDFSHWCAVTERLVMDEEPELLALCAQRAHHVHARVGYDQGPQVPHPAAPEYRGALEGHERWWDAIWAAQRRSGIAVTTMTPEFGPDGYLHHLPFANVPVADLDEINRWMATRQRDRFALRSSSAVAV